MKLSSELGSCVCCLEVDDHIWDMFRDEIDLLLRLSYFRLSKLLTFAFGGQDGGHCECVEISEEVSFLAG